MLISSVLLVFVTLPFSLLFVVKVVQVCSLHLIKLLYNAFLSCFKEYERAVMFRLVLLLSGGARGPGVFFIIPCVDIVEIIDMRVQTFNGIRVCLMIVMMT